MKKTSTLAALILIATLFFSPGCKKETSTSTQVTGNLFGFVTLYDQYGGRVTSGFSSIAVTLTPQSGGTTLNTVPDSLGRYTYNNINQGQYLISFSCPGYGTISNSEFGFLGEGNIDHDVKLSAIPNFYDSILNTPVDTLNQLVLNGTFSGSDTHKRTFALFVGASPAVSSAPANYLQYYEGTANTTLTTFTQKINISDLNDMGFTSGSTVYFACYGGATDFNSSSDVEDYANTGRLSFTALSTNAATTSFVLP
jgi:hypothetical protein